MSEPIALADISVCCEGAIPAVVATSSADGTPNITYLSRVHMVDGERVALSNQFFSKTSRNLAENPKASVLLVDPTNFDQYRLELMYERTERRGPVFERLREDVDALAALQGMQDVFKLRAADVYRVLHIEQTLGAVHREGAMAEPVLEAKLDDTAATARLAELSARLSRCPDLDTLVSATVDGMRDTLGYERVLLLLLDESGKKLFTIASCGYADEGVGSEVAVGDSVIGMAAARCVPMRVGNLGQMRKYSRSVRRSFEASGVGPGHETPVPGLPDARSSVAVPAMALGQLVGVLMVESPQPVAFNETDVALLTAVAGTVASAIEIARAREQEEERADHIATDPARPSTGTTHVRFFEVDGSTFLDGRYLIKGVAGRILWSLLNHYDREGRAEFTNKEVRLDPTLELPEFRDNLESRLILLKRRLEERSAPIRITKTGRGRFRLDVDTGLRLEDVTSQR